MCGISARRICACARLGQADSSAVGGKLEHRAVKGRAGVAIHLLYGEVVELAGNGDVAAVRGAAGDLGHDHALLGTGGGRLIPIQRHVGSAAVALNEQGYVGAHKAHGRGDGQAVVSAAGVSADANGRVAGLDGISVGSLHGHAGLELTSDHLPGQIIAGHTDLAAGETAAGSRAGAGVA